MVYLPKTYGVSVSSTTSLSATVGAAVTGTYGGGPVVVPNPAIKRQRKSLLCRPTFDNMTTLLSKSLTVYDLRKSNLSQGISLVTVQSVGLFVNGV